MQKAVLSFGVLCGTLLLAGPASAQQPAPTNPPAQTPAAPTEQQLEQARNLYRAGVTAFNARRFGEAVINFERSFRLRPHPATLYNAAEARLRGGDPERAVEQLRDLLAFTNPAPDADTIERARGLAREAGVNDLQPSPPAAACPTCPPPPPPPECPPPPAPVVIRPAFNVVPWVVALGGTALVGLGAGFLGTAIADSAIYNDMRAPVSLRMELRAQGEPFTYVGIAGLVAGAALEGVAIFLATRPPPAPPETRAQRSHSVGPIARWGITPMGASAQVQF